MLLYWRIYASFGLNELNAFIDEAVHDMTVRRMILCDLGWDSTTYAVESYKSIKKCKWFDDISQKIQTQQGLWSNKPNAGENLIDNISTFLVLGEADTLVVYIR